MKKLILSIAATLCITISMFGQSSVESFKEGDRAVFLGNSITDGGHYHSYIWLFYMTRFPEMNLRIINAGIGGDSVYDMYKRLDADVFSKRPSVLMVTFGMNDSGYSEYNGDDAKAFGEKRYQQCLDNFQLLEKRLQKLPNTEIVMLGGSPYDETAQVEGNVAFKGKNAVMGRIVEFQKQSAITNNWSFLDLNASMTVINEHNQQRDPAFTLCGGDRVHPDNHGHMVMAYEFLKAQGFVGSKVADVELNAAKMTVVKAENCQISNFTKISRELSFDYLANSLPYPMDTVARGWGAKMSQAKAADVVPFVEQMNTEMLKIKELKGSYKLFIDDQQIGIWSAQQFAQGINLATLAKTPQYQQALSVMFLNEYRWEIERYFRDYAWLQFNFFQPRGLLFANNSDALQLLDSERQNDPWLSIHRDTYSRLMHQPVREALEREQEVLISKIYETNKPVKRKIVLRQM